MIDSGIDWIGCIPNNWKLGYIGQLYAERKVKVSDRDYMPLSVTMKGILPQLSTAAKTDAHDERKLVLKSDFVINSRSDRRGSCGISPYDGSVSLINTVLAPRTEMNPEYYDWLFHSTLFSDEFYRWGHGIVDDLWTTNWSDMKKIVVPIPPLSEQERISNYITNQCTHIDDIIEKTKASIEEYKNLRRAIITQTVTKGIRGDRPMKDSGVDWIGEIPEEWNVIKITRILDYNHPYPIGDGDHGLIKTEDYIDHGIPYLRVQNIGWATPLTLDNVIYISEEKNRQISNSILLPNDILFAKTGATIGKTAIVPSDFPVSNTTSHVGKITVDKNYYSKFFFYYLSSAVGYKQLWDIAIQKTTRPELSIDEIKRIKMIVPADYQEQKEIALYLDNKCSEIDRIITNKETVVSELESYKKSMICEYVTGKKEVPSL